MFASFSDDEALQDSIMARAAGYVLKQVQAPICLARSALPPLVSRCCRTALSGLQGKLGGLG